jgi:hypothetical protein
MSKYETVEVPFIQRGNRQLLTRKQLDDMPWLAEFVERFRHCFVEDLMLDVLWYEPN